MFLYASCSCIDCSMSCKVGRGFLNMMDLFSCTSALLNVFHSDRSSSRFIKGEDVNTVPSYSTDCKDKKKYNYKVAI